MLFSSSCDGMAFSCGTVDALKCGVGDCYLIDCY